MQAPQDMAGAEELGAALAAEPAGRPLADGVGERTGEPTGERTGERVGELTGELVCERRIAVDHPAFAGHFPGQPILPGVLLLAEVVEALRQAGLPVAPMTLGAAKFLAPVGPGAVLTIRVQPGPSRRFEVLQGSRLVASGTIGG